MVLVSETSFHHDEIVLSDDFNSESAVSEVDKVNDDDDDEAVSEIVEEKDCSLNEGVEIDVQSEEHVEEKTDTELADDEDDDDNVNIEPEITFEEEGNLSMEVNDQDHQSIFVSDSNHFSTLLLLLPGLLLLLVLLLLMHFTKYVFSAI